MKAVIIEDEVYNANRLVKLLAETGEDVKIMAVLESVSEAIEWFEENPEPELIFADINLSDGLSFEIFSKCDLQCPIIFTTAYNEFAIDALRTNSIDYLLKPIDIRELKRSLEKYKQYTTNELINNLKLFSKILNGFKK